MEKGKGDGKGRGKEGETPPAPLGQVPGSGPEMYLCSCVCCVLWQKLECSFNQEFALRQLFEYAHRFRAEVGGDLFTRCTGWRIKNAKYILSLVLIFAALLLISICRHRFVAFIPLTLLDVN